ncbi:hypothetical protein ACFZDJ_16450 [Streptomyces sp. NPDC007896]|uniref:hypothetical protein n=1 Tax=Streptomyces sp. NPDC007896 TaxID=3364784 RepID=UPI0036E39681
MSYPIPSTRTSRCCACARPTRSAAVSSSPSSSRPEIAARAAALVADYGASDTALLDVAFGRARAQGRLPFELPRSMAAVEASRPDVPDATEDPVFSYGHGLNL